MLYFDEVAAKWDTPERMERAKVLAQAIRDSLTGTDAQKALEIGCGTGLISFELMSDFQSIHCMDTSEGMLSVIRQKIAAYGAANLTACGAELLSQPDGARCFDVIYSSMVFHHIADTVGELKLLRGFLKPGGRLLIIDLDTVDERFHQNDASFDGHHGFDRPQLERQLIGAGYQDISFHTVYTGTRVIEKDTIHYSLFLCKASRL